MIKSKAELLQYLEADRVAMGRPRRFTVFRWLYDSIWCYERMLRHREYLVNCKPKTGIWRIVRLWNAYRLNRLGERLGFTIPPNCFGKGLYIPHAGTIVVNHKARIGNNCILNTGVNIGNNVDYDAVPVIGDNCYIGPGAKIFGSIVIGDNVKIGANSVVNKSFPRGNCTIVGVPARSVSK